MKRGLVLSFICLPLLLSAPVASGSGWTEIRGRACRGRCSCSPGTSSRKAAGSVRRRVRTGRWISRGAGISGGPSISSRADPMNGECDDF